jgi:hypothetical protein
LQTISAKIGQLLEVFEVKIVTFRWLEPPLIGFIPFGILRWEIILTVTQNPAFKTQLDNLFYPGKILHKFPAIRVGEYFGGYKFTRLREIW